MATVQQVKRSDVKLDKKTLFEQGKSKLTEHARAEAARLNDVITTRQAILKTMKPEERVRLFEHLKAPLSPAPIAGRGFQFPNLAVIDYQVLRPPFTGWWAQDSKRLSTSCVNALTQATLDLNAVSEEEIASDGTLSVEAAIGDFFNARCQPIVSPWFIGEANQATAAIGYIRDTGVVPTRPGFLNVQVDLALDGQPDGWTYFMFPGEPSSGLGLVGSLGIANLLLQVRDVGSEETYERFLLGSASAFYPGDLNREPSFTLSLSSFLPTNNTSVEYAFAVSVELTAFRSIPVQNGGYPGYVQANLTVPGTPGTLGPGTPLRVKEVRTSIIVL